jgi:hypothetical protein
MMSEEIHVGTVFCSLSRLWVKRQLDVTTILGENSDKVCSKRAARENGASPAK